METLDQIMLWFEADKSSRSHNFTKHYEALFATRRNQPIKLLEIGVAGCPSIMGWLTYFKNGQIFGIDNEPGFPETHTRFERLRASGGQDWIDRVHLINMSQSDPVALDKLSTKGPFDIIIDDGSHQTDDIMFSLRHLFPSVAIGGMYVVEDMGCQEYNDVIMTTPEDFLKAKDRWYNLHSACQYPVAFAAEHLDEIVYTQVFASEINGVHLLGSGQCLIVIQKK